MRLKFLIFFVFIPQILWSQSIIEREITDWEFRMVGDSVWKPAKVPGTIIDNFIDLGDISNPLHPYYGDNEKLYQWVGERNWEFRTTLVFDENLWNENCTYEIEFGSLDLFATVYINEIPQYNIQNAFIPVGIGEFNTKQLNVRVEFHSTSKITQLMMQNDSLVYPGGERVYARTAQYQFGWDWGPKFINMGIRKPVILRINIPKTNHTLKYARIDGIRFDPWKLNSKNKRVSVFLDGETNCDSLEWHLKVFLNGDSIDGFDGKWHTHLDRAYFYFLENAQLWWPNGSGKKSNYYEFDIRFTQPGDTTTLAHKHVYYALCDIQLVQKKDKKGESFYFTVNGEKVFAKGANYVPDDSFHPGKNTWELIRLAREANMNMLRVWGGGTYPDDDFYIECMKNGIMVWQDYMYACAMYPVNDDFISIAQDEAFYQNDRLHTYNNIAVWCGNNENEEGWKNWGWQRHLKISQEDSVTIWKGYTDLFHDYLKSAVYDTTKSYISTSPKHGWGRKESMTDGDSHYWGVWWGLEPLEKYEEKVPRFMSEFGMQGMPDLSTLKKVIPDSAMNFDSPKFKNHQKHPTGFQTLDHYLKEYLVVPDNMEDYAYATQILQSYALTIAIEAQRRAMPYCMGSLIWQLNDCWPVTSWSLIDSELKTKIAYHEVSKAFKPTILSVQEEADNYNIYIINEKEKISNSYLQIMILDFYGNIKFKKNVSVSVPANTSSACYKLPKKAVEEFDTAAIYLDIILIRKGNSKKKLTTVDSKQYHFVKLNQLKLPPTDIKIEKGENNTYWITSTTYCPYVIISGKNNEPDTYIGTIGPRNTIGGYGKDWEELVSDLTRFKCLNTILKKY